MTTIAGAVQSLDDSMDKLRLRFRGTEQQAVRLFRARLEIDEVEARIAQAPDADEKVGSQRTVAVLHLSGDVSLIPAEGGPRFEDAMDRSSVLLGDILACLPSDAPAC